MTKIITVCPHCGGDVLVKNVNKLVRGGHDAAVLAVEAGVCTKCGERYYTKEAHETIQQIRKELKEGHTKDYCRIGNTYEYKKAIA